METHSPIHIAVLLGALEVAAAELLVPHDSSLDDVDASVRDEDVLDLRVSRFVGKVPCRPAPKGRRSTAAHRVVNDVPLLRADVGPIGLADLLVVHTAALMPRRSSVQGQQIRFAPVGNELGWDPSRFAHLAP